MGIERVKDIIQTKFEGQFLEISENDLSRLASDQRSLLSSYLKQCLCKDGYMASGVHICSLEGILRENLDTMVPGAVLSPLGICVIATSIGGNAICIDSNNDKVYWAESSKFALNEIRTTDKATKRRKILSVTDRAAIVEDMILLSEDIESFLIDLLLNNLEDKLDDLD